MGHGLAQGIRAIMSGKIFLSGVEQQRAIGEDSKIVLSVGLSHCVRKQQKQSGKMIGRYASRRTITLRVPVDPRFG
jgi:hypothetical protein